MVNKTSLRTDSMIYVFHKKIETIIFRIKAIQKSYKRVNNINLKIRLHKEYEELKIPNVVEITFLNKNATNISDENLEIPNKLDFKNILDNEEIVLQKIWDF